MSQIINVQRSQPNQSCFICVCIRLIRWISSETSDFILIYILGVFSGKAWLNIKTLSFESFFFDFAGLLWTHKANNSVFPSWSLESCLRSSCHCRSSSQLRACHHEVLRTGGESHWANFIILTPSCFFISIFLPPPPPPSHPSIFPYHPLAPSASVGFSCFSTSLPVMWILTRVTFCKSASK